MIALQNSLTSDLMSHKDKTQRQENKRINVQGTAFELLLNSASLLLNNRLVVNNTLALLENRTIVLYI